MRLAIAIALGLFAGSAAASGYLADVPDLPLMTGFSEQAEGRLHFETY